MSGQTRLRRPKNLRPVSSKSQLTGGSKSLSSGQTVQKATRRQPPRSWQNLPGGNCGHRLLGQHQKDGSRETEPKTPCPRLQLTLPHLETAMAACFPSAIWSPSLNSAGQELPFQKADCPTAALQFCSSLGHRPWVCRVHLQRCLGCAGVAWSQGPAARAQQPRGRTCEQDFKSTLAGCVPEVPDPASTEDSRKAPGTQSSLCLSGPSDNHTKKQRRKRTQQCPSTLALGGTPKADHNGRSPSAQPQTRLH